MPGISYPRIPGHEVIGMIEALGARRRRLERRHARRRRLVLRRLRLLRQLPARRRLRLREHPGRDRRHARRRLRDAHAGARLRAGACARQLDSVASAPLLCAGITTFNALRNCGAGPGDLVAVHGVGGLGHLAIQFAARQGFRTVAVNRGRDKEALARSLGAHDYIDSAADDPPRRSWRWAGPRRSSPPSPAPRHAGDPGGLGVNGR